MSARRACHAAMPSPPASDTSTSSSAATAARWRFNVRPRTYSRAPERASTGSPRR